MIYAGVFYLGYPCFFCPKNEVLRLFLRKKVYICNVFESIMGMDRGLYSS